MSLNPYEVRLETLRMAKDIVQENYYANRERLMQNWNVQVETARATGSTPPTCPPIPDFPTEQAIVQKAQFLSEYIDNSKKKAI